MLIEPYNRHNEMRHRYEQDGYKALAQNDWKLAETLFERVKSEPEVALRIANACVERNALALARRHTRAGLESGRLLNDFRSRDVAFRTSMLHFRLNGFPSNLEAVSAAPSWSDIVVVVEHAATCKFCYFRVFSDLSRLVRCYSHDRHRCLNGTDFDVILQHIESACAVFLAPIGYRDVSALKSSLATLASDLEIALLRECVTRARRAEKLIIGMRSVSNKLTEECSNFVSKCITKE